MNKARGRTDVTVSRRRGAEPFLKWAGGKRKHVPEIRSLLGDGRFRTYVEPFLGGGAVFFALAAEDRFERALLSDVNAELMQCYRMVRTMPARIGHSLEVMSGAWNEAVYKMIRGGTGLNTIERAARTIYLNKAGFNGLYRVNKSGEFNVPWGKRKKSPDWNVNNLEACADLLNGYVRLETADFATVLAFADPRRGDIVYFDPPYVPSTKTRDFTSYTADGFSMEAQEHLAGEFDRLAKIGVSLILSQADVPWVRERYAKHKQRKISVRHSISASGKSRNKVGELLLYANL